MNNGDYVSIKIDKLCYKNFNSAKNYFEEAFVNTRNLTGIILPIENYYPRWVLKLRKILTSNGFLYTAEDNLEKI
jgi:hypothetical protein